MNNSDDNLADQCSNLDLDGDQRTIVMIIWPTNAVVTLILINEQ